MDKFLQQKYLLPIVIFIFIVNSIQGNYTELLPDEAYYWVYSKYMNWGFFDHPPLVAVWVKISDFLFNNEMGVRFFSAVSFSLLVYLLWNTTDHPKKIDSLGYFFYSFFNSIIKCLWFYNYSRHPFITILFSIFICL